MQKDSLVRVESVDTLQTLPSPRYTAFGSRVMQEESRLNRAISAVKDYRWMVAALVGGVFLASLTVALCITQKYRAKATVQIDREDKTITLSNRPGETFQADDSKYFQTQIRLLENPGLLAEVVERLRLSVNPKFASELNSPLSEESPAAPGDSEEAKRERYWPMIETMVSNLEVAPVENTRLVEVRYRSADPQLAASIANEIASAYVDRNMQTKYATTHTASEWLQKRIAGLKSEISKSSEAVIAFEQQNPTLVLSFRPTAAVEHLAMLNRELVQAETGRVQMETLYRQSLRGDLDALAPVQKDETVQALAAKLSDLRQRFSDLSAAWKPDQRELDHLKASIEETETQLAASKSEIAGSIENRYQSASAHERGLRDSYSKARAQAIAQNQKGVEYYILKQELANNKELYDMLQSRAREMDFTRALELNNARVVTPAIARALPAEPARWPIVTWSTLSALAIAGGLVFVRRKADGGVHSIRDVREIFGLNTIGVIPSLHSIAKLRLEEFERPARRYARELCALEDARSPFAESFRMLRTFMQLSDQPPRIILVTSAQPSEGKTTTAINTALSLAETGARVAIVDADMRKPYCSTLLDVPNDKGLSTFLGDECEVKECIYEHSLSSLSVIPSGPLPVNPADLVASHRMTELIGYLGDHFDYVIVDSPPVVYFADTTLLSRQVDGVMLVVNSRKSTRQSVSRACSQLIDARANVLGVVLNNVDGRSPDYYGYDASYYYSRS